MTALQIKPAKSYLYTISRRDLPLAQQAIQSAHAALEYAYQFGRPSDFHPSYINLTVRDKYQLEQFRDVLNATGIKTAEFHEPYMAWGFTAISCCVTEEQRYMFKNLQLWKLPTREEVTT